MTAEKLERIGKYNIIGLIGRGGMATVYKALHPELDRVVALKVLNRALVHSPEMLERFRREARAIAALRHPNIVQVFDLEVADDVYFMVMEFIEGETLSQRLIRLSQQDRTMPLNEMLRVIASLGEALDYAHQQGMLHRDIKPANIMFRNDGGAVLTDFGVAKILNAADDITATGSVAGTPAYMAPEQWTDDEPDKRSDIYSLGIVLYQLVTGRLPFDAETPGRLMFKHLSEPPPLPRNLNTHIPLELERIILRALAKDPQDRYQTAGELVEDLKGVVYQIESTAPTGFFRKRPQLADRGGEKKRALLGWRLTRRRLLFLAGAAGVALLTAVIGLFLGSLLASTDSDDPLNATGTAQALRMSALDSTSTPSPSSPTAPLPTATPAAGETPAPSPSPTLGETLLPAASPSPEPSLASASPSVTLEAMPISPTPCSLTMTLVQDVNYANANWWGTVDSRFEKIWLLRNDGPCPWPQGLELVHLDGEAFGLQEPFEVAALPPSEQVELTVPLRVPGDPGQYEGRFRLRTPAGEPLGEPLTVQIEARLPSALTPTPGEAQGPLRITGYELIEWREDAAQNLWYGTVSLWAEGGTGEYTWYRDTLDNPLSGGLLQFEWGMCRDFFGSVWVQSGDALDHEGLYIPYPGECD